jgi:23S rRNA (cytosine1962-C5)-methyltransferase
VNIESANSANLLAQEHLALNGFDLDRCEILQQDVFKQLRFFRDARRQFDIVILDPPKFAESASQLQRAGRAYKDINLLAIKLLRPGGLLFTFSCSGHVVPALFQKMVADAAQDAGRHVTISYHLHQAEDHPVALNFPEGLYLKGMVCRAD